ILFLWCYDLNTTTDRKKPTSNCAYFVLEVGEAENIKLEITNRDLPTKKGLLTKRRTKFMRQEFTLPQFPSSTFEIETSIWTGKSKLWKDGELYERSSDQGKPFLIPTESGELYRIYPKSSFPDLIPSLEINGIKHTIVEKLPWPQYALALLPMILIFIGGGLGGAIGAVSTIYNLQIFRTKDSDIIKYLNVVAVSILAYIAYLVTAYLFFTLIN